jgi:hypothetical protein
VSSPAVSSLHAATAGGPPQLYFVMLGLISLAVLVNTVVTKNLFYGIARGAFIVALAAGKPWARVVTIAVSLLEVLVVAAMLLILGAKLAPAVRVMGVVIVVFDLVWVYALMLPRTVQYFRT